MERDYLNQKEKQVIAILSNYGHVFEANAKSELLRGQRWEEALPLIEQSAKLVDKAMKILYKNIDPKQKKALMNFIGSSEMIITSRADPRNGQNIGIVDWDDMIYVIGAAVEDHCTMCFFDEKQVKACKLRKALLRIGATDPGKGVGFSECVFSKR